LQKHLIGGHIVHVYKDIEFSVINELMYKIKYLKYNKLTYNIFEFNDITGKKFPKWHSLSHPHLNFIEFSCINPDILVNMQFSSKNFNNCYLLSNQNLLLEFHDQYITNNFYFFEKKELLTKLPDFNTNNYLNKYSLDIKIHIENIKNLHKI